VGWTAFRFGITCYILPFMFFFGPGLLMQGSPGSIGIAFVTGCVGVFAIAASVVGYLRAALPSWARLLVVVAGVALLHQNVITDLAGIAALALLWFLLPARCQPLKSENS
nr:hypothetical protein [Granulosicoccus sp.]